MLPNKCNPSLVLCIPRTSLNKLKVFVLSRQFLTTPNFSKIFLIFFFYSASSPNNPCKPKSYLFRTNQSPTDLHLFNSLPPNVSNLSFWGNRNHYFYPTIFFSILFYSQSLDSPLSIFLNLFPSRTNSHKFVWICNLDYKFSELLKVAKGERFYNFWPWISKDFCFQKFWDTWEYSFIKVYLQYVQRCLITFFSFKWIALSLKIQNGKYYVSKTYRTSLVVQWLRICLPMRGTRVGALAQEDPTCHGATGPVCHNCWAWGLEPTSHNCWAHVPQLLRPACLEPVLRNERPRQWEAHAPQQGVAPCSPPTGESLHIATKTQHSHK